MNNPMMSTPQAADDVVAGENLLQFGGAWRLGETESGLMLCHKDAEAPIIWAREGTPVEGDLADVERLWAKPLAASTFDCCSTVQRPRGGKLNNFFDLGDWRVGDMDGSRLYMAHAGTADTGHYFGKDGSHGTEGMGSLPPTTLWEREVAPTYDDTSAIWKLKADVVITFSASLQERCLSTVYGTMQCTRRAVENCFSMVMERHKSQVVPTGEIPARFATTEILNESSAAWFGWSSNDDTGTKLRFILSEKKATDEAAAANTAEAPVVELAVGAGGVEEEEAWSPEDIGKWTSAGPMVLEISRGEEESSQRKLAIILQELVHKKTLKSLAQSQLFFLCCHLESHRFEPEHFLSNFENVQLPGQG